MKGLAALLSLFSRRQVVPSPATAPAVARPAAKPTSVPSVPPKGRSKVGTVAKVAAVCMSVIGGYEALRTEAYRDIVGVPTICWGETQGVRMGDRKTVAECNAIFTRRLDEFASHVEACVPSAVTMPVERYAAHVSLAYNVGWADYCGSTVARRQNAGDVRGACEAFLMWDKAGGKVVKGLTRRRADERALCLKGI